MGLLSVDAGGAWTKVTLPDQTVYKEIFETTGWRKGLTSATRNYDTVAAANADTPKKWTTITYTQDDENLTYQKNPRVIETNIYDDSGNQRRATISYTSFGLPNIVKEWTGSGGNTVYRTTTTTYRFDGVYLDRRIIGLPDIIEVRDSGGILVSRTGFAYDWQGLIEALPNSGTAIQHDPSYDVNFYYGRGNRVLVQHFDVNDGTFNTKVEYKAAYNTNGQVSYQWDPNWHFTRFSYVDSFSDSVNHNTYAYPTTITDPDNFNTTAQYNFDFGAVTRTQSPAPAGQTQGAIQTSTYDSVGRLDRITLSNNGAYTRYVYPTTLTEVQSFSTINDAAEQGSTTFFDGAGRVRATSADLPGGTTHVGQYTDHDVMGRVSRVSNPTEIDANWLPAGDDSSWVYTLQSHDWKGRPLVTTMPDGWTTENVYGGCGCAGGEVVTTRDEAGRRRRATSDVLGRLIKLEELTWSQTVDSTTNYTYNVRDQLTTITQQNDRVRTFNYDGYGRLQSRTTPEQGTTTYTYFDHDLPQTITDARGSGYAGVSTYASGLTYRAFGGIKGMNYGNGRNLSVTYDNRLRPTRWNFGTTQDYKYFYDYFNEHTGRVGYAQNMNDNRLDRSYEYDNFGRLAFAHTGAEARAATGQGQWGTMDGPYSLGFGYDVWGNVTHRYGWGGEVQGGSAGQSSDLYYTYNSSNRRTGFTYDATGNLTADNVQQFTYDATGQQRSAVFSGYSLQQEYDGNGFRVKKTEGGTTYYLRSSVFGGQVVAEINWFSVAWGWNRGYVYSGSGLLAVQYGNAVSWVHEDPITKSKRITNSSGTVVSSIELDPWGADAGAAWSSNSAFQPRKFTTYDRDGNGSDEAMFRRHNRAHSRFDQPDPSDGSYSLTNPQSFNRYSYVQNDPVTFVDPSGLDPLGGVLGGWAGITLNPPSGSVTINGSFNDFFSHGGTSGDGTEWRTLAVIDRGDLNSGIAETVQLKPLIPKICPPTAAQLANDPKVIAAMQQAWRDSRPGTRDGVRHEEGGWGYTLVAVRRLLGAHTAAPLHTSTWIILRG